MNGSTTFLSTTANPLSDLPTGTTVKVALLREQVPVVATHVVLALVVRPVGKVTANCVRALSKEE